MRVLEWKFAIIDTMFDYLLHVGFVQRGALLCGWVADSGRCQEAPGNQSVAFAPAKGGPLQLTRCELRDRAGAAVFGFSETEQFKRIKLLRHVGWGQKR